MSVGVSKATCNFHFSSLARHTRMRHPRNKQRRACWRSRRSKKSPASGEPAYSENPRSRSHTLFRRERTATNLVNAGAASVSDLDLPKYVDLLTPSQKVNVLYRDHLTRPVPRSAAEEITVRTSFHVLNHL